MRDTFAAELEKMMSEDPSIILITGDLGFGVFDSMRENFPNNFINVGVAEQNMTGIAAGLALEGFKIFTYSIANFSTLRCIEQIRNDVAYHNLNVNIVSVGAGFSYGPLGMTHHATEDIAMMRSIPDMTIFSPSTLYEAEFATRELTKTPGAGYLRIDKSYYDDSGLDEIPTCEIGRNRILREGDDITLLVTGGIIEEALLAAKQLEKEGISCKVSSCHSIKPFDEQDIIDSIKNTRGIITIEEHTKLGGLGGLVAEICLENDVRPEIFKRIGLSDTFSSTVGSQNHLRKIYDMDSKAIISSVKEYF
jgi:transketolase